MKSLSYIPASDGSGDASLMTITQVRTAPATTITVNTVAGVSNKFFGTMGTPHTFTDPVTGETITVISEATAVNFAGHIDSGKIEIDAIAPGETDLGSKVGDIVVIRPTTQWADNIHNVLSESLDDDGTLKDRSVTLPKINGGTAAGLLTTDASGLVTAEAVIRQDNTTNSALPGFRLEHGWGWFTGSGANFGSKTMTFSSTFNNAPVVVVSMIGYKDGSNPSSISDFSYWESCSVNAGVLKNTGFNVGYRTLDGSNVNSNRRIGYSWIAIGT